MGTLHHPRFVKTDILGILGIPLSTAVSSLHARCLVFQAYQAIYILNVLPIKKTDFCQVVLYLPYQ